MPSLKNEIIKFATLTCQNLQLSTILKIILECECIYEYAELYDLWVVVKLVNKQKRKHSGQLPLNPIESRNFSQIERKYKLIYAAQPTKKSWCDQL